MTNSLRKRTGWLIRKQRESDVDAGAVNVGQHTADGGRPHVVVESARPLDPGAALVYNAERQLLYVACTRARARMATEAPAVRGHGRSGGAAKSNGCPMHVP